MFFFFVETGGHPCFVFLLLKPWWDVGGCFGLIASMAYPGFCCCWVWLPYAVSPPAFHYPFCSGISAESRRGWKTLGFQAEKMKGVLTKKGICQNQPKPSFFLFCFGESCEPTVSFFWKGNVDVSLSVPSGKPVISVSAPNTFWPRLSLTIGLGNAVGAVGFGGLVRWWVRAPWTFEWKRH